MFFYEIIWYFHNIELSILNHYPFLILARNLKQEMYLVTAFLIFLYLILDLNFNFRST